MTLATAKQKVLKAFKTQNKANGLELTSSYNITLITFNKAKSKLNYCDGVKLTEYYNKLS